jgi:hydrogenase maturation protease
MNKQNTPGPAIAVIGVGNVLYGDDGIGVYIVRRLQILVDPGVIEVIDGGISPDVGALLNEDVEKLIIVDAMEGDDLPGTVRRFDIADLELPETSAGSFHQAGLDESLKLLAITNPKLKSVVIFGIKPKDVGYGLELSPELEGKITLVVEMVLKESGLK